MIGIYKIENKINSKVYIGQSVNIENRWKQHKAELRHNNHQNNHLQNAWNKYGENNFKFSILCTCDKDDLNDKEINYINFYNSTIDEYGYNIREGGNSKMAKSTIEKLRGAGSSLTKEDVHRIKISMWLLMDRKEISQIYNISTKVLTSISQGKNWGYILPELNDKIHNLKQSLIDERNKNIVFHYDNGLKISEITKMTGLTTSVVEKAIYKYRNIKSKDTQMEKYNKIFELHKQGVKNYQISKIVNVSPSTVQRYLSNEQHPLNKPKNKKLTKEIENKIIEMYYKENLGSIAIGNILNISKTTVMNVVNNYKYKSSYSSEMGA